MASRACVTTALPMREGYLEEVNRKFDLPNRVRLRWQPNVGHDCELQHGSYDDTADEDRPHDGGVAVAVPCWYTRRRPDTVNEASGAVATQGPDPIGDAGLVKGSTTSTVSASWAQRTLAQACFAPPFARMERDVTPVCSYRCLDRHNSTQAGTERNRRAWSHHRRRCCRGALTAARSRRMHPTPLPSTQVRQRCCRGRCIDHPTGLTR